MIQMRRVGTRPGHDGFNSGAGLVEMRRVRGLD